MIATRPAPPAALSSIGAFPYALSRGDHAFFEREIHRRCGIVLGWNKAPMMARRLSQRLRALGVDGFDAYRRLLEEDAGSPEWQAVISAVTTNRTEFFREVHHFKLLEFLLRTLVGAGMQRIRLWSAACSTGEEAYSMALTAWRVLHHRGIDCKILATDIDEAVLETARTGCYDSEAIAHIPRFARAHFEAGPDDTVVVAKHIRTLVSFKSLNLISPGWPMRGQFDAIFCRNVLIYFDAAEQSRVVGRMRPLLSDPGLLCLGHSEALPAGVPDLERGPAPTSHVTPGLDLAGALP
jgi:chemotaxis protein methyltransferase CheR